MPRPPDQGEQYSTPKCISVLELEQSQTLRSHLASHPSSAARFQKGSSRSVVAPSSAPEDLRSVRDVGCESGRLPHCQRVGSYAGSARSAVHEGN